jgi:hypothetical protein
VSALGEMPVLKTIYYRRREMSKYEHQCEEAFKSEFFDDDGVPSSSYKYWPAFKAGWESAVAFKESGAANTEEKTGTSPNKQSTPLCPDCGRTMVSACSYCETH